jgi:hypothetical protein
MRRNPEAPSNSTQFTSIIVSSFGFSTLGMQYLQIPGGAMQFLSLLVGGCIRTRWSRNSRCIMMTVANAICILGAGLLVCRTLTSGAAWSRCG